MVQNVECTNTHTSLLGDFNGLQVKERVEIFAHYLSLSPLHGDLVLGQGSEQDEERDGVANGPVGPHFGDACLHRASKIVLLNVKQIASGVHASE